MANETYQLMLVTQKNKQSTQQYFSYLKKFIHRGITCVQLREKQLDKNDLFIFAIQLKQLLQPLNIPLIINDHLELAKRLEVGLHLGQQDGCALTARQVLGEKAIIGLTVNNLFEIKHANSLPIDYVGVGAIFPTANKPNVETVWGLQQLAEAKKLSNHRLVAIGGIDATNIADVMQTKVHGVAAIGAFHNSEDPTEVTQKMKSIILESNNNDAL